MKYSIYVENKYIEYGKKLNPKLVETFDFDNIFDELSKINRDIYREYLSQLVKSISEKKDNKRIWGLCKTKSNLLEKQTECEFYISENNNTKIAICSFCRRSITLDDAIVSSYYDGVQKYCMNNDDRIKNWGIWNKLKNLEILFSDGVLRDTLII
jgi:hypothetical protein